ncbi:AAA family ATPase [Deefgea rivuli]|uniref:AAA family ATPase n=1 Tax=Deefgea rivuli TaxID=400948 RepID=UPI0005613B6A|nr:AAA family ATPase [Deefgea rivuli]
MLELEIENLRNIKKFKISLPFEKGVYAVTATNGTGKSTIFSALAKVVYRAALKNYFRADGDSQSKITYRLNGEENTWVKGISWNKANHQSKDILVNGFFEGSIIFGNRFSDAHTSLLSGSSKIKTVDVCDASDFVKENLGFILKNNKTAYPKLMRVKSISVAKGMGFNSIPYINEIDGKWIHQFKMSSGEFLIIGLLHYIQTKLEYKSDKKIEDIGLIIMDEVELALHPAAQNRLSILLNKISAEHNFCVYLSTHSPQIINNIRPDNIYHIESSLSGSLEVINPCYPAYATRCMNTADGFDLLLLVEDELAKNLVEKSIRAQGFHRSRLIKVLPCGGWEKTLELHEEMQSSVVAGVKCKIISILDGDIKQDYKAKYENGAKNKISPLAKGFLPIQSLEKYLLLKIITNPDDKFIREFGDLFYRVRALRDIVDSYKSESSSSKDSNGKGLFLVLKKCAEEQNISAVQFKLEVCNFISDYENLAALSVSLERLCS